MANEINVQLNAQLANGALVDQISATKQINQGTQDKFDHVFSCTTSDTALTITVGTMGWCFITNLDSTNYVAYGPTSGGAIVNFGKIKPGETHALRLYPGITFRAQANTATCLVRIIVWND